MAVAWFLLTSLWSRPGRASALVIHWFSWCRWSGSPTFVQTGQLMYLNVHWLYLVPSFCSMLGLLSVVCHNSPVADVPGAGMGYKRAYWGKMQWNSLYMSFKHGCSPEEDGHDSWACDSTCTLKYEDFFIAFLVKWTWQKPMWKIELENERVRFLDECLLERYM